MGNEALQVEVLKSDSWDNQLKQERFGITIQDDVFVQQTNTHTTFLRFGLMSHVPFFLECIISVFYFQVNIESET